MGYLLGIAALFGSLHLSGACESGRLLAATLPDSLPFHAHRAGIYVRQEASLHDQPVYKHEQQDEFLYYVPSYVHGAQVGGYWVIGQRPADGSDGSVTEDALVVLSAAKSPELARESWMVKVGEAWEPLPNFLLKCVSAAVQRCPANSDVAISGRSSVQTEQHAHRMGLYARTSQHHQERPVYMHVSTDEYLFHINGSWLVGPEVGAFYGSFFVRDWAYSPELIAHTWMLFSRGHFVFERSLTVTCADEGSLSGGAGPVPVDPPSSEIGPGFVGGLIGNGDKQREEECSHSYCANEGICLPDRGRDGKPTCLCRSGYKGRLCERVVTCGPPPQVDHGQLVQPSEDGVVLFPFRTLFVYRCQRGYHLNGQGAIVCDSNGKWTKAPKCRRTHVLTPAVPLSREERDSIRAWRSRYRLPNGRSD